jgi:hypothetical protein
MYVKILQASVLIDQVLPFAPWKKYKAVAALQGFVFQCVGGCVFSAT